MRDDAWLLERFEILWRTLFPDLERKNIVHIKFKGQWKTKFGHIRMLKTKDTEIVINILLADERIPETIIDLTIAHEIVHYLHGFQSPHPRRYTHPHAGGVVTRELRKRGFTYLLRQEKEFLKQWPALYSELTRR